jgi:hypothetical protein
VNRGGTWQGGGFVSTNHSVENSSTRSGSSFMSPLHPVFGISESNPRGRAFLESPSQES